MKKKVLLRRSSEALAAVVIIISVVVYSFALISGVTQEEEAVPATASSGGAETLQAEADVQEQGLSGNDAANSTYQNETDQASETKTVAENTSAGQGTAGVASTAVPNAQPEAAAQATGNVQPAGAAQEAAGNAPAAVNASAAESTVAAAAQPAQNTQLTAAAAQSVYKYIQIDSLNVRSGPGSENEKLAELTKGNRVQVLRQVEDWLEVITPNNVKGYIYAEYTVDSLPPVYKYVSVDTINVRSGAGSDTEKLSSLPKGSRVQVLETIDEWLNVVTSDNLKGYVYAEYVSDNAPVVYNYVNTTTLNVRKGPGSDTTKLATLKSGDRVQFLESKGEWSRVKTSDNVEGYVYSKYVVKNQKQVSRSETAKPYNSDLASQVLEYAKKFTGVKYVYGGESSKGFDCSGFTQYVYKHFKINVPRSAAEYDDIGTKISRSDMKPGDIILFDRWDDWTLGHVGIYMGNDRFIHASSSKGKVVIAKLSEYSGNILGIRRVLK